jgi:malonyl-CoA decarboxylase
MSEIKSSLDDSGIYRIRKRPFTFSRMLDSILEAGRDILERRGADKRPYSGQPEDLGEQCRELLNHRGEASGIFLASEILADYEALSPEGRLHFFELLSKDFGVDPDAVIEAAESYRREPSFERLTKVSKAVEAPRQKLFRRLNMAPGGTSRLVKMRGHLLKVLKEHPELRPLDADLRHLLIAWFNRGFLVLDRIDWSSSANVLEKIIEYEAVHEINGWEDLRGRLDEDRRCFAFFHPAMPDDPVMFVEVALTNSNTSAIQPLIASDRETEDPRRASIATFYSISNCHRGLQGISFGNFLIKQVTEELRNDPGNIKHFETLSPVSDFRHWLASAAISDETPDSLVEDLHSGNSYLQSGAEPAEPDSSEQVRDVFLRLCAHYLLNEKSDGKPLDSVARFHLGNGASLERINWAADNSPTGMERSVGIMVNYVYRLNEIEKNHEAYFAEGEIAASSAIQKLARR